MKANIFKTVFFASFFLFFACGEGTDVVESGVYEGSISEVEPEKTEIYVETVDGQTLELYFTDETELTRNGEVIDFSELEEGMNVEVEVVREGKRLDPITVRVLE